MHKTTVAVIVVAVGAVVGGGTPYATGLWTERLLKDNLQGLADHPQTQVRMTHYERGWTSSRAETEITLTSLDDPVTFRLDHRIEHGPRPTVPGLARITTTPRIPEAYREAVTHYFGDRPPLKGVTRVGLLGDQHARLSSPPVEAPLHHNEEARLDWAGLEGQFDIARDQSRLAYRVDAPRLRVEAPEGDLYLEGTDIHSDMHREGGLWLGESRISIGRMQVHVPSDQVPGGVRLLADKVELHQDVAPGESDNLLRLEGGWTFGELRVRGRTFRDGRMGLTARRIDRDAYQELQERLAEIQGQDLDQEEATQKGLAIVGELLPRFLRRSPEVEIEPIRIETPRGNLDGQLQAGYQGGSGASLPSGTAALQSLDARGQMAIDKALLVGVLETVVARRLQQNQGLSPERARDRAPQVAQTRLALLQGLGVLVSEGDRYTVEAEWRQGSLTVNGQSLGEGLNLGAR